MKRLLPLLPALFISAILQGQILKVDGKKFRENASYRNAPTRFLKKINRITDTVGLTQPKAYLVHPKPGIHRLPQDNMSCVVPDLNATVAIPNVWSKTEVPFTGTPPRIPNPAKPFKLSPSRPLLRQPDNDSKTK